MKYDNEMKAANGLNWSPKRLRFSCNCCDEQTPLWGATRLSGVWGFSLGALCQEQEGYGATQGTGCASTGCRTICGQDRQESTKVKPTMVWVQGNIWDLVTASGRSNAPGDLEFSQGKARALQIVSEK